MAPGSKSCVLIGLLWLYIENAIFSLKIPTAPWNLADELSKEQWWGRMPLQYFEVHCPWVKGTGVWWAFSDYMERYINKFNSLKILSFVPDN